MPWTDDEKAFSSGLLAAEMALPLRPGFSRAYWAGYRLGWSRLKASRLTAGRRWYAAAMRAAEVTGVGIAPVVIIK